MELKKEIEKYALQNAVKFNGKANIGAVIGKVLAESPSLKKDIKRISKEINEIINKINKLGLKEQEELLKGFDLKEVKKEVKKHELKPLKKPKKVVMRFEPSPSGPLHIGHSYVIGLNSEYCRKYKGKLILRISDTNPENIYEPAYKLIQEDAQWITKNNVSKIFVQSDRMEIYYKYAEKLIKQGNAYVCTCSSEEFKNLVTDSKPCDCRALSAFENLKRWKKMFEGYEQGEAVVRIKTDIAHKNPAMRDWPALRINETKHPRHGKKYRVWPLMNFSVAVDDIDMGVTHIIRAKDHADNAKKQEYIFNFLKKPFPETLFVGRINFEDIKVSCSYTRERIEKGEFHGWDDIRLPFLQALKRRGYVPDAFIKYALDVGVTQNDKKVSKEEFFKGLNAFNKDLIDREANRYFFVENPKLIKVKGAPEQKVSIELHPDFKERGKRNFKTKKDFYISENDFKSIKENEMNRLMDCLNLVKKKGKFEFDSLEYEKYKKQGKRIIHWLPKDDLAEVEVLMEDNSVKKGLGERGISSLKVSDVIQFERFGFCRLDSKSGNKLRFWFAHR